MCIRCEWEEGDELHAVRDCCCAKEIWNSLIPSAEHSKFYNLGKDWLLRLLRGGHEGDDTTRWSEKMRAVCLLQWRWRNMEVFEGRRLDVRQRLRQVVYCFEETDLLHDGLAIQNVGLRPNRLGQ